MSATYKAATRDPMNKIFGPIETPNFRLLFAGIFFSSDKLAFKFERTWTEVVYVREIQMKFRNGSIKRRCKLVKIENSKLARIKCWTAKMSFLVSPSESSISGMNSTGATKFCNCNYPVGFECAVWDLHTKKRVRSNGFHSWSFRNSKLLLAYRSSHVDV